MFEHTFKNFNINFDTLHGRNTFSSGDVVSGQISFDLTKETKITSLTMKLKGRASVRWSTGSGKNRRHHSAKEEFFNFKRVIMQGRNDVSGTLKLLPGRHVYPFCCQLPEGDFPSSFHGPHGEIMYTLVVGISRPWHMSKDFVTELDFRSHFNTNQPDLWAPLSGSNRKTLCCLWCASGPITMTVTLAKKAFFPGETVKIICQFSNASTRTVTPKAKLQQKLGFYTHQRIRERILFLPMAAVTGEPIRAQTSDVYTEMILTIPTSASLTISNCSIIEVDCILEVSLGVKASHDLVVLFPIILYKESEHSHSPPTL